jgi:hypothetical protein
VEYPTPLASIGAYVVPEQQQALLPASERAMFADVDRLLAAVPRDEIAVQWDVAVEFSLLEEFYGPIGPQAVDAIIGNRALRGRGAGDQAPGTTSDQARLIDAALADSPGGIREWGVCTECGMGRS